MVRDIPKHLLFVALAGYGHVNPTLPLVEELVRRGHRVDYATAAEHSGAVNGAGARWVTLPPLQPFTPPPQVGPEITAGWLRHFFAAMRATYPVLRERCVTERPDVVCYDATNWPARIVAGKLGIPAVRCVPNLASNETYSLDAQMTAGLGADHPAMAALAADCAQFSAEHGVELDLAATMDVTEALNLVFVPRKRLTFTFGSGMVMASQDTYPIQNAMRELGIGSDGTSPTRTSADAPAGGAAAVPYIKCDMAGSAEIANQRPGGAMTNEEIVLGPLPKGITLAKEGMHKKVWNVLGHTYSMKTASESSFAFETFDPPGSGVPPHVHPTQDEHIYIREGCGLSTSTDSGRPQDCSG
jgi:hypothetical protein